MIVSFGNLTFDGDCPISGYTQTMNLNTEAQDQDKGKPATLIKGPGLEQQQFTVRLLRPMGVVPETEIARYRREIDRAVPQRLVMGGRVIGGHKWLLKSVTVKEVTLGPRGKMLAASVELSFEEFVKMGTKEEASDKKGSSGAPGISAGLNMGVNDAYKVGWPSAAEKADKVRG